MAVFRSRRRSSTTPRCRRARRRWRASTPREAREEAGVRAVHRQRREARRARERARRKPFQHACWATHTTFVLPVPVSTRNKRLFWSQPLAVRRADGGLLQFASAGGGRCPRRRRSRDAAWPRGASGKCSRGGAIAHQAAFPRRSSKASFWTSRVFLLLPPPPRASQSTGTQLPIVGFHSHGFSLVSGSSRPPRMFSWVARRRVVCCASEGQPAGRGQIPSGSNERAVAEAAGAAARAEAPPRAAGFRTACRSRRNAQAGAVALARVALASPVTSPGSRADACPVDRCGRASTGDVCGAPWPSSAIVVHATQVAPQVRGIRLGRGGRLHRRRHVAPSTTGAPSPVRTVVVVLDAEPW